MFLAFKEMARAKVRFALLIAAIALLVFLILFQQSLQNGLITGFIGAIREQNAPVLVYSVDGQRVLQGSVITPEMEADVRAAPGAGEVGPISQGTFTGLPSGNADGETFDTTVIGYELGPDGDGIGAPTTLVEGRLPTADDEAVVSDADVQLGYGIDDTVRLLPGGKEITIVGVAENAQLNVAPTLFVSYATYLDAVKSVNPDAGTPLPNVLGVIPADGYTPDQTVASINEQSLAPRRADQGRCRRRDPRGRAGAAVVQHHLPALRARRALRDRAVLPDRHVPEGQLADAACARSARLRGDSCRRC
jgi:putative ABC transport system permease protein